MQEETCENCGKVIATGEQACLFQNRVICEECDGLLRSPQKSPITKKSKLLALIVLLVFVVGAGCFLTWLKYPLIYQYFFCSIRETPLGESSFDIIISPNGNRAALFRDNCVIIDGVKSEKFESDFFPNNQITENFVFSPDSQKYAYVARIDKKNFIEVDVTRKITGDSYYYGLTFSPDSKKLGYIAGNYELVDGGRTRTKCKVVVDGKVESEEYGRIFSMRFLPASGQLAYAAYRKGIFYIYIDDAKVFESKKFDGIGGIVFSSDGKRIMFGAKKAKSYYVVIDGKESPAYDAIGALSFSPDGKKTFYVAKLGNNWSVVENEAEKKDYDGIIDVAYSPDSSHLAYLAHQNEKGFLVIDGIEQKKYDGAHLLTFSPDNKRVAFCANVGRKPVTLEEEDYEIRSTPQVVGEDYIPTVGKIPKIENVKEKFPNAKGMEKINKAAGKICAVIGNKEKQKYEVVANLTFSPDGKNYVYWATDHNDWMLVVNDVEIEKYDKLIYSKYGSSDNELRFFLAGRLVFYPESKFVFDTPSTFYTLAEKNGKIVRINVTLN